MQLCVKVSEIWCTSVRVLASKIKTFDPRYCIWGPHYGYLLASGMVDLPYAHLISMALKLDVHVGDLPFL